MMRFYKSIILTSVYTLTISACSFIPDVGSLNTPTPESYPNGFAYDNALINKDGETLSDINWQNYFLDDTLKQLIEIGLENNRELRTAALSIEEARTQYGIQRSDLLPDISATGGYTRQKGTTSAGTPSAGGIQEFYSASVGMTAYELDLFGRVRSLNEAALNDFLATQAAYDSVRISLISSIAQAYVQLKTDQALLQLAEETVESQEESYNLIDLRMKEGIASDLDLKQAETLLQQARADYFESLANVAQDENALRLLLGTPETMPDLNIENDFSRIANYVRNVPVGLPSELLTTRPDIIQAEYNLKSANADIGAARAAFFPMISLTTTGGYRAGELGNLFENGSQVWNFAPQISVPIFTGGRLKNSLELSEIRKQQAIINYESTIETAFRETADALAVISTIDDRVNAQQNLVNATQEATRLSTLRYDNGIDNYLTVLDARRELYSAERSLLNQQAAELFAKINLYRAVGGGLN